MAWVRRAIVAGLGVLLIVDALVDGFRVVPFVVGLIMAGLLPVDYLVDLALRPAADEGRVERLREVMGEKPAAE